MCTAIAWQGLFGRNLDLWCTYGELVAITPRHFAFPFASETHYAMIGMAHVTDDYPLYYEAVNEVGLAMAGLNFPHSTVYSKHTADAATTEVPPYAFIPYLLANCGNIDEVRALLAKTKLVDVPYRSDLPNSPLHWLLTDQIGASLVVEATADGLQLYEDPVGVLTNEPPFPYHMARMADYAHLQPRQPSIEGTGVQLYSGGLGAVGLPGDWSSSSRFVRAAYVRRNLTPGETDEDNVLRFFHMLDSVAMPEGALLVDYQGRPTPEITVYACCCDLHRGIYYYKTHACPRITAIRMDKADIDNDRLTVYPWEMGAAIRQGN